MSLAICCFLENSAMAQSPFNPDEISDTMAYQKTMEICSRVKPESGSGLDWNWNMVPVIQQGIASGWKLWGDDALQISTSTTALIHSAGYEAALDDCYGPSDSSRGSYYSHIAFTGSVICADVGGHIVGILGWMIPLSVFSKIFLASRFALENPQLIKAGGWVMGAINKVVLVGLAGYVGWEGYRAYDMRMHAGEYLKKYNDNMVKATQEESDETYVMVQKTLFAVNAELARGVKDPDREKFLLAWKAELEKRVQERNNPTAPEQVPLVINQKQ